MQAARWTGTKTALVAEWTVRLHCKGEMGMNKFGRLKKLRDVGVGASSRGMRLLFLGVVEVKEGMILSKSLLGLRWG